jgi:transposase
MSTERSQTEVEQVEQDLFGEGIVETRARREAARAMPDGEVRLRRAVHDQAELRVFDLEGSVAADHPVRAVWGFVQALDLSALHAGIRSRAGHGCTPATDPAILVALWLWATIDGVGSAREIDRLCERDDTYRGICGGVGMNYHTLADFRTEHAAWLEAQLTASMVALLDRRLVTLNVVAQDGLRVRAAAKASSMRRRERLQMLHAQARAQLQALEREVHEDAGASSRRKRAAAERGARERDRDEPPSAPPTDGASPPGAGGKTPAEPRASSTDAQARVMKMADGGFTALAGIEALDARGTAAIAPAPRAFKAGAQSYAPKRGDSEAVRRWRARMLEPASAALYKLRGATVECANAQLRRRGLSQFNVRGLHKAKAVLLWHALAHNLIRMRSLGIPMTA